MNLDLVTLVVDEYDPAIQFFVHTLGFDLVEDSAAHTESGDAQTVGRCETTWCGDGDLAGPCR